LTKEFAMSSDLTQDTRISSLQTPLGKDVLVLVQFEGREGLSELFEWRVEAISEQENINFDAALGRACAVVMKTHGADRSFNGTLVEAQWLGIRGAHYAYRLVMRPWLWLLSRTSDCRIFSNKTAPDIIKEVFTERGFNDFDLRLTQSYPTLKYCVQYRETDLAFVSRLMEQHGIYYFFEHSSDKHTLLLADSRSSHAPIPGLDSVPFIRLAGEDRREEEHLHEWAAERRFCTGKVELNDYDFKKPNADLLSDASASAHYERSSMELYDYPGKYWEKSDGERYAKVRMEAEQALDGRRRADGDAASLVPGGLVRLVKHPTAAENQQYLVVRSAHRFETEQYRTGSGAAGDRYYGNYEFLRSDQPFRSPITTPRPLIHGIQTAKVVGKSGEEIDVDEFGRILVRFFWDRKKKQSCRLRVGQIWAGRKWGGQVIPRIGMEVIVEFLEGDPDRPLITGAVYNEDHKLPYDLPANKTKAGVKSDSSKGGNGYNEFMFEDHKGKEQIGLHAEKDYKGVVRDTEVWEIGERFTSHLGPASRNTTLKSGDDHLTVSAGNQVTKIALNQMTTIDGTQATEVIGPVSAQSDSMMHLQVGASSIMITPASITLTSPSISLISAMGVVAEPMTETVVVPPL
jgi:type VI secretion system secreted protein VgrG